MSNKRLRMKSYSEIANEDDEIKTMKRIIINQQKEIELAKETINKLGKIIDNMAENVRRYR